MTSNSSKIKFSECQKAKGLDLTELPSYGAAMASNLNSPGCGTITDSSESAMAFGGNVTVIFDGLGIPIPIANATLIGYGLDNYKETTSIACEQVMQIAKRNYDTSEKIKCILSQNSVAITTVSDAINDIRFISDGDVRFYCPNGFNISQKINIKVNNTNEYSDSQIQDITETVIETVKSNTDILLKSESGWASTPQGQKTLQEVINKTSSSDFAQQCRQTVVDITSEVQADNSIVMKAKNDIIISGDQCNIEQDTVLEIVSQTIINSIMKNAFKEYRESMVEFVNKGEMVAKNEGAGTIAGLIKDVKTYAIIGGIVIVVLIVGLILYSIFK